MTILVIIKLFSGHFQYQKYNINLDFKDHLEFTYVNRPKENVS